MCLYFVIDNRARIFLSLNLKVSVRIDIWVMQVCMIFLKTYMPIVLNWAYQSLVLLFRISSLDLPEWWDSRWRRDSWYRRSTWKNRTNYWSNRGALPMLLSGLQKLCLWQICLRVAQFFWTPRLHWFLIALQCLIFVLVVFHGKIFLICT